MLRDKWEFCSKSEKEKRSKVLAKEKLDKEEVKITEKGGERNRKEGEGGEEKGSNKAK